MRVGKGGILVMYALALAGVALFVASVVLGASGAAQAAVATCVQACFLVLLSMWLNACS